MTRLLTTFALFAICLLSSAATGLLAQEGRLSGTIFGDYYWLAQNHNETLEGRNGTWLRRIYLTYDRDFVENVSVRLRLEAASPGNFTSGANAEPFLKDAYLQWRWRSSEIFIGLSPTPAYSFVEPAWGYRHLEKTPADLQGLAPLRELGFAIKGASGKMHYHFMLGNGNGNGADTDKGKKIMLSLRYAITEKLAIEGYGEWDDRPGDSDRFTVQGFLSWLAPSFRGGVLFVRQTRNIAGAAEALDLPILSAFAAKKLGERFWGVLRFDRIFKPNPDGGQIAYLPFSAQAKALFVLAGVDYSPAEALHFIPNLELVAYGDAANGETPRTDLIPRLTFSYEW